MPTLPAQRSIPQDRLHWSAQTEESFSETPQHQFRYVFLHLKTEIDANTRPSLPPSRPTRWLGRPKITNGILSSPCLETATNNSPRSSTSWPDRLEATLSPTRKTSRLPDLARTKRLYHTPQFR